MDHHRRDDILSKKHRRHEDSSCEWSEEEMLDHFRSGLADRDSLSLVRYHTIANADPHERSLEPYKSSSSKKYGYSVPPLSDFDPAFRLSDSASKSHTPHRSHTSLDPLPYSYYPTLDQYYSSSGHNYRTVSANNHWPVATQRSRAEDSRVHVRMDSLELRSPDGARVRGTGVNISTYFTPVRVYNSPLLLKTN